MWRSSSIRWSDHPCHSILLLLAVILSAPAEACVPSWFRAERAAVAALPPAENASVAEYEDDYDEAPLLPVHKECDRRDSLTWCRNGGKCLMHYSYVTKEYVVMCVCPPTYRGERCQDYADRHVFAAQLLASTQTTAWMWVLAAVAALAILGFGVALFSFRRLMIDKRVEEDFSTPFSRRDAVRSNYQVSSSRSRIEMSTLSSDPQNQTLELAETSIA